MLDAFDVGAFAPDMRCWHYDGVTAMRRQAVLIVDADSFVLHEDGTAGERHAFDALTPPTPTRAA